MAGAATVLLLDRPRHSRDDLGRFSSNPGNRVLYFPKAKYAPAELKPPNLRFDRDKLIFKPMTDHYKAEQVPLAEGASCTTLRAGTITLEQAKTGGRREDTNSGQSITRTAYTGVYLEDC